MEGINRLGGEKYRARNMIATAAALALLVFIAAFGRDLLGIYVMRIINLGAIYAVCALSMNLVNGFTGLFSLGQPGFMAIGAYVTTLLMLSPETKAFNFYLEPIEPWLGSIQLPFIVSLVIGGLVAALCAYVVGFPVLRLRGDYLAIATLGFSEIINVVIVNLQTVTNGALGIKNIPPVVNSWWVFGVLAAVVAFILLLMRTSHGRAIKSIREDETAAQAMGIDLFKHKMMAFAASGFIAGIAGGLMASLIGAVDAAQFRYLLAFTILLMVVLGGQGSVSGSVVGAFLVTGAQEWLRFVDEPIPFLKYPGVVGMRMVTFSALLMVVILFWSRGIFGDQEFSWNKFFGFFERLLGRRKGAAK